MRMPSWLRLPGHTVRVRLTVVYTLLFLVSGAVLLAIASGVTVGRSSASAAVSQAGPPRTGPASPQVHRLQGRIAQLQGEITHLQSQANGLPARSQLGHVLLMSSLLALAIMTIVSAVLGWVIAGRALRPVQQMTTTAQRISEDNLHERLAMTGPRDELKELGDTIDGLLARLEGAFAAQRRFVANASHELRTPLTTMRATLDVALAKPEPAPPQTVALAARLRAELDRTDALLEAFLVLARVQHRQLPGFTALPLEATVAAALAAQAPGIAGRNLTVQDASGLGAAWVAGSEALLSRLVDNVVGNAVSHNADGGWIRITTHSDGLRASLTVENGGPVLEQRQVDGLVQPFQRLGADRTGSDQGSGLGLSIVAAIAEAHGGTVDLRARDGGGLRVLVELPAAATRPVAGAGVPG